MGWQNIKLPEGYTWKEYMYFLLDTLPEETKQSYLEKLRVSREFWKYKGGCLDLSTIRKLTDLGIKFYVQKKTNYKTEQTSCSNGLSRRYRHRRVQRNPHL